MSCIYMKDFQKHTTLYHTSPINLEATEIEAISQTLVVIHDMAQHTSYEYFLLFQGEDLSLL